MLTIIRLAVVGVWQGDEGKPLFTIVPLRRSRHFRSSVSAVA
jgi:hypothetical protein